MRKHLLWYLKGWPQGKALKERICQGMDLTACRRAIEEFAEQLARAGVTQRAALLPGEDRFAYDPYREMDRQHDRGLSDESCG